MVIILCLYLVALWAVFSKFKLVRWAGCPGRSLCSLAVYPRDISRAF